MTILINTLDKSRKNDLSISTLEKKVIIFVTKQINVAIIGTDAFCIVCKLKKT